MWGADGTKGVLLEECMAYKISRGKKEQGSFGESAFVSTSRFYPREWGEGKRLEKKERY